MAVVGLVIADNHHRLSDARRIWKAVETIPVSSPREIIERTRVRLVYHTGFGDLDAAVTAARILVETERQNAASASLLRALRWASNPLKYSGSKQAAIEVLVEAYSRAEQISLHAEMWNAAEYLAILASECEDIRLSEHWVPVCGRLGTSDSAHGQKLIMSKYLSSTLSLLRGDFADAKRLLKEAVGPDGQSLLRTRLRETAIAMDIVLRLRSHRGRVTRSTVAALRRLHLRTRECGFRDFEAGALFLGLLATNQAQDARQLYHSYVATVRRSRLPMHSVLIEAGGELSSSA
jgi:hypothetical protein